MSRVIGGALVFLLAWFCPAAMTPARAGQPIIVSGVVRWFHPRDPASGIIVALYPSGGPYDVKPLTTRSMVNGSFILRVPAAGEYRIGVIPDQPAIVHYQPLTVPASGVDGITLLISDQFRPRGAPSRTPVHFVTQPPMPLEVTDAVGRPVRRGTVDVWLVQSELYRPPAADDPIESITFPAAGSLSDGCRHDGA